MPPGDLPPRIDPGIELYVGDEEWILIEAQPDTAADILARGELRMFLSRERPVSAGGTTYTLPSIAGELPKIDERRKLSGIELAIPDDDWRNVEFVSMACENAIAVCLEKIAAIHNDGWTGNGWSRIHVRSEIPQPLGNERIKLDHLFSRLGMPARANGLGFASIDGLVRGAFSIDTPGGLNIYGRESRKLLTELCLHKTWYNDRTAHEAAGLADLAIKHRLVLVDWCQIRLLPPDSEEFAVFVTGQN